ncbi:MAG: TolC family protein, partial [Candidatus Cloacimonadota bacterium]|nr:TolC family protein [Candidatus Cloacimonadota bacterium]
IPTGDFIPFSSGAMGSGMYKTAFNNELTVQQPIFNGGKVILGFQMAKEAKSISELNLIAKTNEIVFKVVSAHLSILRLNEIRQVYIANLNAIKAHLKTANVNFNAGVVTQNDVLNWEVQLSKSQIQLDEIDKNIVIALDNWKNLLGTSEQVYPQNIEIKDYDNKIANFAEIENISAKTEQILNSVEANNPNIKSLEISNKLFQKKYNMAKGEFLPSFNIQYSYQFENDDKFDFEGDSNWNVAGVFSMPLFSSGENFSKVKKAKYELKKNQTNVKSLKNNILLGAKNSYLKMITNAKKVERSKKSLNLINKNYNLTTRLFNEGMLDNNSLLDAETMFLSGKLELISSYFDFILNEFEIEKWIGAPLSKSKKNKKINLEGK